MMEGLLKKFQGELGDVVTAEGEQAHNFKLTKMHLTDTIKKSNSDRNEKAAAKGATAASSAKAKGDLADTRKSLAEDKKMLADMTAEFKAKSATFAANQKVRSEELEAVGKAIEIMGGDAVAGGYKKNINLAQAPATAASLLQMR